MDELNSVLIEGHLVRDPHFRSTPKGTSLCTFTISNNRYYDNDGEKEREVNFFDVETWGKLADGCFNIGTKGRGIRVVGRLKQDRWTGSGGKQHSRVSIVAEHIEFRPDFNKTSEE
jgi:single-strand DNA-binding protein